MNFVSIIIKQIWRDLWAMPTDLFDPKFESAKLYNGYIEKQQKQKKELNLLAMAQMKDQDREKRVLIQKLKS